jgi:hypothetical protein
MENNINDKRKQKTDIDREVEEFMKMNKDVLYKRTSEEIGKRQHEGGNQEKWTSDGSFTKVSYKN